MKVRSLTKFDTLRYMDDLKECYSQNHLIFDSQNMFSHADKEKIRWFLDQYIESVDSNILGIFDDEEQFLYGAIIFDNIRFGQNNKSYAELHIVTDKLLWGKQIKEIYKQVLESVPFTTLSCSIPAIAVHAIRVCKLLGFKKTGYIPEALPYVNSKGEELLYDLQIWTWKR